MPAKRKDYDEALEMYKRGFSIPKVAAHYKITNQAMYVILKRRGCKFRKRIHDENAKCKVDSCGEPVKAKGYCSRHLYQFNKHGKIISVEKMKMPGRRCSVEGCNRKHRSGGYCDAHNQQIRKHGKIINKKIIDKNGISSSGKGGYVLVLKKDHPMANKRGYVLRSHLVWEENTGHVVTQPEVIHHKNGNRQDDHFKNLEWFPSDKEHQRLRHREGGTFGIIKGGII